MSRIPRDPVVVGVDVGGPEKGFHAVALDDGNSSNRWPCSTQRQLCNGADLFMRQRSVSMHPAPGASPDEPDLVSGSLLPPASECLQHRALLWECAIHFIAGCSTGPSCSVASRRTISSLMGVNRFLSQCVSRPFLTPWPVRSQEGFFLPGTNAQTVLDCFAKPGSLWTRLPLSTRWMPPSVP